jgi:hypothetical protein
MIYDAQLDTKELELKELFIKAGKRRIYKDLRLLAV